MSKFSFELSAAIRGNDTIAQIVDLHRFTRIQKHHQCQLQEVAQKGRVFGARGRPRNRNLYPLAMPTTHENTSRTKC